MVVSCGDDPLDPPSRPPFLLDVWAGPVLMLVCRKSHFRSLDDCLGRLLPDGRQRQVDYSSSSLPATAFRIPFDAKSSRLSLTISRTWLAESPLPLRTLASLGRTLQRKQLCSCPSSPPHHTTLARSELWTSLEGRCRGKSCPRLSSSLSPIWLAESPLPF